MKVSDWWTKVKNLPGWIAGIFVGEAKEADDVMGEQPPITKESLLPSGVTNNGDEFTTHIRARGP